MNRSQEEITSILATDCGSTTTKAILIEKQEQEFHLVARGEAPTTVEAPVEDVTCGVLNAIADVEEQIRRPVLEQGRIIRPKQGNRGVDLYLSTSSAGGGLQMMVAGVVREISAESAARAALGAGAIVVDVVAANDGRPAHERIERIRKIRPDMILFSGGVDGGTVSHVVEIAQLLSAGDPTPRLGADYKLPVIYAGNRDAQDQVRRILEQKTALQITENLRPSDQRENLGPARQKIQSLFLEHVMAHAPGYKTLMEWADSEIMPTPLAVGLMMQRAAESEKIALSDPSESLYLARLRSRKTFGLPLSQSSLKMNILGVDIGGATTDVFSVFRRKFHRTVSANLGMSYSISHVLEEAGVANVLRWIPFELPERELQNQVKNKMIRPTTMPQQLEDLAVEQAVAREALRLSFEQHKLLAVGLKGIQQERTIAEAFSQATSGETLVNLKELDLIIGSGGVLSHAPRRAQAALMMVDAFLPEGITFLSVDSIFMMPQLGVLSEILPEAAKQVFERDCLVWLGTCIAPVGESKEGNPVLKTEMKFPGGNEEEVVLRHGELKRIPLGPGESCRARFKPARGLDAGQGRGEDFEALVRGGAAGLILDGRGRSPFSLPGDNRKRMEKLQEWNSALQVYSKNF